MKTIASMDLLYEDDIYHLDYEFEKYYTEEDARDNFFTGNRSCDCNKAMYIRRQCGNKKFPNLECGNKIKIENFKVTQVE